MMGNSYQRVGYFIISTPLLSKASLDGTGELLTKIEWGCRDNFVNVPSQWETMLHCDIDCHWLSAFTKWSLVLMHWWVTGCGYVDNGFYNTARISNKLSEIIPEESDDMIDYFIISSDCITVFTMVYEIPWNLVAFQVWYAINIL